MRKLSYSILRAGFFFLLAAGLLAACSGRKKLIRPDGLYAIQLGDELPPPGTQKLKGISLRDTLLEEGDFTWRAALMEYKKGTVWVEEDFFRSEVVNRIRIETPELHLKNGLCVGMTVGDLRARAGEWYIVPLPEYRLFDFYSRMFPRVHFVVDDPATDMTDEDWRSYRSEQFSPKARIVAIVVF